MKKKRALLIVIPVLLMGFCLFYQKEIRKNIAGVFFKGGEYYFSQEKYNIVQAERFYKIAIFSDYTYSGVHYQLGRIYFLNGSFDKAIAEFGAELSNHPDFSKSYYMRGLTNGYARKYENAVSDFEKYISANPKTWAGYNDLTWIYLIKNDWEKAKETAEKGLQNDKINPWLRSNLGIALMNLEKFEEAKKEFLLAKSVSDKLSATDWTEVYPGNSPRIAESGIVEFKAAVNLNLAIVNKKLGMKSEAERYYNEYLAILPENDSRKISADIFLLMP